MIPVRSRSARSRLGRRDFLRAAPAGLVGGMLPAAAAATQRAVPQASTDALACAQALADLEFTDAEHELMLAAVARNGRRYAELRQLHIPADTEPAFAFHPYLPGGPPTGSATPHAALSVARASRVTVSSRLEDLAFQSVTVLSQLLERREVTSTDLTRMYIARLKRFGERLNCVVTLTEGLALAQAGEADREIRAGRYRGPLHGIPWGAKDLFATRGVRTTWGARPYEQQVIDQDATVVERLRTAGAVLVAKLSMGALALGGVWFGGSTRNPWDLSRSSSGSSAGPAAATAAGLVGFSLGTETLGSIISPSAACGVTGLRPTYGRVSRHGAMALSWTMDKIGPMCRSVEDCVLVFNAMYGPDGRDLTVVDAPFGWAPDFQSVGLRVGYVASEFAAPPDGASPDQRRVWEQEASLLRDALVALRGTGMIVEPVDLPAFPADALRIILNAEAATAFDDLTRSRGVDRLTRQGARAWPNTFRSSRFIPAVEYIRAQRARTLLAREMDGLMMRYDAFVSSSRSTSLMITNLTGHPALALKAGFREGLPVALMITGRLYDEATVLQIALAYERATTWHTMHPPLA